MALTASFSATQSLANNSIITFVDTSTGVDNTITNRRIFCRMANGNWLTENGESATIAYTDWSYSQSSIALDLLSQSTALDIEVIWYAGSTPVYNSSDEFCFNLYDYLFMLQTLQGNTSSPNQIQDTSFYTNLQIFMVNLFNEGNAIEFGGDIYSSQNAMNMNAFMIQNSAKFF